MRKQKRCGHCRKRFMQRTHETPSMFAKRRMCTPRCAEAAHGMEMGKGDDRLGPHERLIPYYAHDCAACQCRPTHMYKSGDLPCLHVARDDRRRIDRCLGCGLRWTARTYRWEPLEILTEERAA